MIFSSHVVDTGPVKAVRRKTPKPAEIEGMLTARTATCAPFTAGALPRPQFSREAMFACWESADDLDRFLEEDSSGQVFAGGWEMRMELYRAVGVWPGLDGPAVHEAAAEGTAPDGPSVAITIGTAFLKTALPFIRVNNGLERQFLETDSGRWGTGFTNLPQRLVGSFSIWDSGNAAVAYMRSGAHAAAMAAHYDPKKDPTGHTFVTAGGFFGFRPLSTRGTVGGRNPLPEGVLTP